MTRTQAQLQDLTNRAFARYVRLFDSGHPLAYQAGLLCNRLEAITYPPDDRTKAESELARADASGDSVAIFIARGNVQRLTGR